MALSGVVGLLNFLLAGNMLIGLLDRALGGDYPERFLDEVHATVDLGLLTGEVAWTAAPLVALLCWWSSEKASGVAGAFLLTVAYAASVPALLFGYFFVVNGGLFAVFGTLAIAWLFVWFWLWVLGA